MARYCGQLSWIVSITSILTTISLPAIASEGDDVLPPPPDIRTINEQTVFYLGVIINHYNTHQVVAVTRRAGDFWISSADLQRIGIPAENLPQGQVNISKLPQVQSSYDSVHQLIMLTVPKDWVPERLINMGNSLRGLKPRNGSGALLNYDLYSNHTEKIGSQASLWHELRFFGNLGTFSTTGRARKTLEGYKHLRNGYRRYDTTFTATDEDDSIIWSLGDVINDGLNWTNNVRIGGFFLGKDFSLRPDIITYPLPVFSGDAAVPTTVDVFLNGYRAGSRQLEPGPFTLTNLPYINGYGDAVLVTTDALGRQVSTTLPFYVASTLLKKGLSDGGFTLGSLRRNYGIKNFDYGTGAASGSYRYGVNDYWTAEGHIEAAKRLGLAGLGSLVKLGNFGVLNGAWSQSRFRGRSGHQANYGYQYTNEWFNIGAQFNRRSHGFGNLALYDLQPVFDERHELLNTFSRSSDQYLLGLNMGQMGNFGAAWLDIRAFDDSKTKLLNLSWTKTIWRNTSLYLSATHERRHNSGWSYALSVILPFSMLDTASITIEKFREHGSAQRVDYTHTMPSDGGFSWNLAYARQSQHSDYQQASLGWRNDNIQLQGGVYGQRHRYTQWGEVFGSLVLMDKRLFAANQINDSFVVVSTSGEKDVPVNYEHQLAGTTDHNGYLLVAGVPSYYPASYSINTLDLPADTQIAYTEQRISLKRRTGYLLDFPIVNNWAANVILHDEKGRPLPVSSQVQRESKPTAIVGYDGVVWLEDVGADNQLLVTMPNGKTCQAAFTVSKEQGRQLKTYGPLICRRAAP